MVHDEEADSSKSRQITLGALAAIALLTVFDVWEDAIEGASLAHMMIEVFIITCCVVAGLLTGRSFFSKVRQKNELLRAERDRAREDLQLWRSQTMSLSRDLHSAIATQLKNWGLSPAETEIAFLLLKGLSIKEIAVVRDTSERTVRQQTSSIYQKANLSGRTELSAFFMEDLLSGIIEGDRA